MALNDTLDQMDLTNIFRTFHPKATEYTFFSFFKKFFFSTFIYFWDRERQSMNGGGAEREGDTESETGSRL